MLGSLRRRHKERGYASRAETLAALRKEWKRGLRTLEADEQQRVLAEAERILRGMENGSIPHPLVLIFDVWHDKQDTPQWQVFWRPDVEAVA